MDGFIVLFQIPEEDNASYSVALSLFAATAVLTILLVATMTLTMTRLSAMGICGGQNSVGGVANLRLRWSSNAMTRPTICCHLIGFEAFHRSSSRRAVGRKVRPEKLHSTAAS